MSQARSHATFLSLIRLLGYFLQAKGLCHGLTCMWMQAVLIGEEQQFIDRCLLIFNTPDLAQKIEAAKNKVKNKIHLNETDKEMLEVLAFVEGMQLYHEPESKHRLFAKFFSQNNMEEIVEYVASQALQKRGGIARLLTDSFIGNQAELTQYLFDLAAVLSTQSQTSIDKKNTFDIHLSSHNHAISLHFDIATKTWRLIDANQLDIIDKKLSTEEIAQRLIWGLSSDDIEHNKKTLIAFNTKIFTTKDNPDLKTMREKLQALKDSHVISREMSTRATEAGVNLAYIAAKGGDIQVIKSLATYKVDFNQRGFNKKTPLHIAAEYGYSDVVTFLLENNVDINLKDSRGLTAAHLAAVTDRRDIIAILAKHKANFDLVDKKGMTPILKATKYGHVDMLEELAKQGANLNKTDKYGNALVHYAALNNDFEIAHWLVAKNADFTLLTRELESPAEVAIDAENWKMAALILAKVDDGSQLSLYQWGLFTYKHKQKLLDGFIGLLQDDKYDYRQLAQDVIDGKNALGQIFNTFQIPFSSFFTTTKYKDRVVTESVDRIAKALIEVNTAKKPHIKR